MPCSTVRIYDEYKILLSGLCISAVPLANRGNLLVLSSLDEKRWMGYFYFRSFKNVAGFHLHSASIVK